jgi:hypothetical protein
VHLRIRVGAAVAQHREAIVEVGGLPESGQHHPAGGDAAEHQGLRLQGPEHDLEVAAGERADPFLDHHDIAGLRCHGRVDLGARVVQ